MSADLIEKTERYGRMLSSALDIVQRAPQESASWSSAADECIQMAQAYLSDGEDFHKKGDYVKLRYGAAAGWSIKEMGGTWADE